MKYIYNFLIALNLWWFLAYLITGLIFQFDYLLLWLESLVYVNVFFALSLVYMVGGVDRVVEASRLFGELHAMLRLNDEGKPYLPEEHYVRAEKRRIQLKKEMRRWRFLHLLPVIILMLVYLLFDIASLLRINVYLFWSWYLVVSYLSIEIFRNYLFKRRFKSK